MVTFVMSASVAVALAVGHAAAAQSAGPGTGPGGIVGIVRDSTGVALATALVQIYAVPGPELPLQTLVTNSVGAFRADSLPAGTYAVAVALIGNSRRTDTIVVREGRTETIAVTLRSAPLVLQEVGRAPGERDASALKLRFRTMPESHTGLCSGVYLVETTATSIRVTGFTGSANAPLDLHARAYRDGSGIVLDVIPQQQDIVVMITACVEWEAQMPSLQPGIYTLNVRQVSDPRGVAEALVIFNGVVDLRHPDTLLVSPPAQR